MFHFLSVGDTMGKLFWAIIIILVIGGYMIKTSYDLDLNDNPDRITFAKKYFGWIFDIGKNTKDVVGYAAQKDWLPTNNTNETNKTKTFVIDNKP